MVFRVEESIALAFGAAFANQWLFDRLT